MRNSRRQAAVLLAILVLLAGGIFFLLTRKPDGNRPSARLARPWSPHAIQTTFAGLRVEQIDNSNAAIVFLYDLNNRSDSDYQLLKGPDVIVMRRLKSSGTLSSEKPVALRGSAFLPAKNRARISLQVNESFAWPARAGATSEGRFRQLIAKEVTDLGGFVIFNQFHRVQIDLPGSWPFSETEAAPR